MSASNHSRNKREEGQESKRLMEQIVSRENMTIAYKRVKHNNGEQGLDGLTVRRSVTSLNCTGHRSRGVCCKVNPTITGKTLTDS